MTVLAEGVEKPEQLALLRKMGCDMAQGFHFTRPVSAEGMAEILRRQPFVNR
jgi:EAL domain-containing protein (putative c-di-GMP-specific phosphodiesterase class I)